ncbi:hypothetical protein RhiirC2_801692, partial [Rhizophagus irregularis]
FFSSWTLKTTGIGALHFGLVSVKLFHIGETLHFGSVSRFRSGIGCNLWILGIDWHRLGPLDRYRLRPLETCVSISIGWNLLDRCQVRTFGNETCGKF